MVLALFAAGQLSAERSIWQLVLNEIARGDVIVVLDGTDVWVPARAFEEAGIKSLDGAQRELFGERHVLLNSLAPMVRFELDEASIRLLVTASPNLFSSQTYSVLPSRPPGLEYRRSFSTVLNYGAHWESGVNRPTVATELAVSALKGVFVTGAVVQADGQIVRGLSTVIVDQPSSRRRWAFGDAFGPATELGSRPLVLGVSVASENSLDPYYHPFARPGIGGEATLPSRADVYVDGQLVRQLTLPPGPFRIDRLPMTRGIGNVNVVVQDPFGRQQTYGGVFYLAQTALGRGAQDYGYVAGLRRDQRQPGAVTYGHFVVSAMHRIGITDSITLGAQAEGDDGIAVAGPIVNLRLWRAGELGWTGLVSARQAPPGQAHTGSYLFTAHRFSAYAVSTYYSRTFASLDRIAVESPDWFGRFEVAVPAGRRLSVTLGGFRDRLQLSAVNLPAPLATYGAGFLSSPVFTSFSAPLPGETAAPVPTTRTRGFELRANVQLRHRVNLWGSVRRLEDEASRRRSWESFIRLDVTLGGRMLVSAEGASIAGTNHFRATIDRSLPIGPGYGFHFSADSARDQSEALLEGQNRLGSASMRFRRLNGVDTVDAAAAGSVAVIGDHVLPSRPLNASFALVEVPGSRGVRVTSNNQPVGRTNRWGYLIVPDLIPYVDSRLGIADEDLPLDYAIANTTERFALPFRGGAVIRFAVAQTRTFTGRIVLTDGDASVPPEYGTLTIVLPDGAAESPLSKEGEFYLMNVPPGRYRALAISGQGRCNFDIQVPAATTLVTSLGEIRCARTGP
jgi:outer membrane usher protein